MTPKTGLRVFASSQSIPGLSKDKSPRNLLINTPAILARSRSDKHSTSINIGNEHNRAIDRLRKAHIRDIRVTEVHFSRASCAFNEDDIGSGADPPKGVERRAHRDWLVLLV